MTRALGLLALLNLACSVMVHFATFVPGIPVSAGPSFILHLTSMAAFGAMVFSIVALQQGQHKKSGRGVAASWRSANQKNREFQSRLFGIMPFPVRVACAISLMYSFATFILVGALMGVGTPFVKDGNYILHSHGKKIRDITKEEYQRYRNLEVRLFSGGWILFSIVPTAYFLTVHPRLHSEVEESARERT